jgi:DNA polymerase-3 subunit alpha
MNNADFCHLHTHSDASLRDGLGTVQRLVARAKTIGFNSLALTDHGTLANAISFTIECERAGIKPIIGLEGYVEEEGVIGHITLLADGNKGFDSLMKLNNIAHYSRFKQPAFTVPQLVEHSSGLVCLTGCISSPLQQASLGDAVRIGTHLKRAFGTRLFAELMFVGAELSPKRGIQLSERLGIKPVITNDVHFPFKEDGGIHSILTSMKSGFSYDSEQLYLRTAQEMHDAAHMYGLDSESIWEMLKRAGNIAKLIGVPKLKHEPNLPKVGATEESIWEMLIPHRKFLIAETDNYYERFQYEMEIISEMGYLDYFAILKDIVNKAKELGVEKGAARGSGAGSLILYALGITDVDPMRFGLQFERFLNPLRTGFPDVDVDFESERRDSILDYAAEKYGAIPIATYSRYSHKSLTRDLGKHFKANKELVSLAAEEGENSDAFAELVDEFPLWQQCYESFMGQIRHKGKHAGGVVITDQDVPTERVSKSSHAAAWTEGKNSELSFAGLVKFDLLGLSVLSALREMKEAASKIEGTPVDLPTFPEKGHEVFELFQTGNLSGIFQFSGSDGIRNLTVELQPETFEELVAINAVYRPGAIDAGALDNFPKWKKEPRIVPAYIADVLEETYGSIVYQEQFMEIYRRTVSGTLAEADQARRLLTKAKPDDPVWREKFLNLSENFQRCANEDQGLFKTKAKQLWEELSTHTRYSFNKSHAVAYTLIAWQTAFFKHFYPAIFYAAMLNHDPAQQQTYILDAIRQDLEVSPPNVNKSGATWTSEGNTIFLPLSAVKFLGDSGVQGIIHLRDLEEDGSGFWNMEDFMNRVPKSIVRARAREGLYMLGAFKEQPKEANIAKHLEILGIKTNSSDLIELSRAETTFKYLGFVLPNRAMIARFAKLEEEGYNVGTITSREIRNKGRGFYAVYRLSPSGVFWSNKVMDLEKGSVIAVKIGNRGRATEIKKVR